MEGCVVAGRAGFAHNFHHEAETLGIHVTSILDSRPAYSEE